MNQIAAGAVAGFAASLVRVLLGAIPPLAFETLIPSRSPHA